MQVPGLEGVAVDEDEERRFGPAREVPHERTSELATDAAAADEDDPARHRSALPARAVVTPV